MASLSECGAGFTVHGGDHHQLHTKAKFKLSDGVKATVEHRSAAGGKAQAMAVSLAGKQWEVQHEIGGKGDTKFKYKWKQEKLGTISVKQVVPGGNWAMVPNPEIEISRGGWLGEDGKIEASYDFLNRVGQLEEKAYANDKKQKAWVKVHTQKGTSFGVRSKLGAGPLLHSAACEFSQRGGVQLTAKSKWKDESATLKVKSTYEVDPQLLKLNAKLSPKPASEGAAEASLTMSMAVPVRDPRNPRIHFGIKWDL